jgi:hypothetical protein
MNPLVKKEIRLLLPSFGICCALALPNLFFRFNPDGSLQGWWWLLSFVFCGAMAVMLALNSFGAEISSGTFSNLLAQPVSRQKIWDIKISLLAASLLILGIFWGACGIVRLIMIGHGLNLLDFFTTAGLFGLAVFSGGLWTVLLLRQVAAAFWFTVLVPGFLLVILMGLFADHSDEFGNGMIAGVLGIYSLVGFFFARWLFFRAQDIQWSGGAIVLPEMRGLARLKSFVGADRMLSPRAALWRKEIQLHQSQFVIAFVLVVLHLIVLATRKLGHFGKNSTTELVLESFWALWLVMPLLVGSAAVAEERRLGTHENQLCLPVKRRTQFVIKLFVAVFLSVLLGVVMPILLEGTRILPNVHFWFNGLIAVTGLENGVQNPMSNAQIVFWICLHKLDAFLPLLTLTGIAAAIGVISLYASSLTRNTLQTLAPAGLGILLAFFMLISAGQMRGTSDLDFLWRGPLPYFIAVPVLTLTLMALALGNFQHVRTGWRMWWRNLFALALTLVFVVVATTAVYHRAWEKLTPFEPAHGAARLSQSNPASLTAGMSEISVRLPDGKIWMTYFTPSRTLNNPLAMMLGNVKITLDNARLISGSNWLTVQRTAREFVGIKTDGSLWVSQKPMQSRLQNGQWKMDRDDMQHLVPFGNETNWNSLVSAGYSVLLVKTDGTLWRWGARTNFAFKQNEWPGLREFTPYRLGMESNWSNISIFYYYNNNQMVLRKTDGSLWMHPDYDINWDTNGQALLQIEPGFLLQSMKNQERDRFRSVTLVSYGLRYLVGVRDDGTFRILANQRLEWDSGKRYGHYNWYPTDLQIGNGTNWIAVAGVGGKIVTLKSDGSLWLWDYCHDYRRGLDINVGGHDIQATRPVRLGTHSDWVAISGGSGNATALAADGSLWFWPVERPDYYSSYNYNNNSYLEPLLDISRKPQFLGNVFGKAD